MSFPRRDEVWLTRLDRSRGSQIRKTQPCLVVSPDEMDEALRTVLVAPMTRIHRGYPTRVAVAFGDNKGQVALDQIRAVDRERLIRRLGAISETTTHEISGVLLEMFAR